VQLSDHPLVTRWSIGCCSTWPDVVFQRILVVETTIPLSQKELGYDHAQLESFVEFVGGHMEQVGAEKAEIESTDRMSWIELKNPAPKKS
jgi:hypothetical protein